MSCQTHWVLRVGDGNHFRSSSKSKIWGIYSNSGNSRFIKDAKNGDILWFLANAKSGKCFIGVATFIRLAERVLGPLIAVSKTNEELGWTETPGTWNIEVHYNELYDITRCNLDPQLKGPAVIRQYNDTFILNLPDEYSKIVKYSNAVKIENTNSSIKF